MTPAMSRATAIELSAMPVIIAVRWPVSAATWLAASSDRVGWASVPAITTIGAASRATAPAVMLFENIGSPPDGFDVGFQARGPARAVTSRRSSGLVPVFLRSDGGQPA